MTSLCQESERAGFWKLVSRVFVEKTASRKLLQSLGFREVGIYEKHGQLDSVVWRDVVIVERLLESRRRDDEGIASLPHHLLLSCLRGKACHHLNHPLRPGGAVEIGKTGGGICGGRSAARE